MPSTITHAYFIEDLYKEFDIDTRLFLRNHKENLKVFAQSLDTLNFCFRNKKVQRFAHIFHSKKTGEFLTTLINYIKYNYYSNNPEVMSYLYGMLAHYVLDTTIHPYVIYKTGAFNKNKPETYKYNAKHHEMEAAIDKYMIEKKEKIKSYKFKHYDYCFNVTSISDGLKDVINFSFRETYNIKNFDEIYLKSIYKMKKTFKILRYDPIGIKLLSYYIFDFITPKKILKGKFLSYHYRKETYDFYLNTNKEEWHHPVNNKKYKTSFEELYKKAIQTYLSLFKDINDYIYKDKTIDISKKIKNLSYITGLDLNSKQELKHFKF